MTATTFFPLTPDTVAAGVTGSEIESPYDRSFSIELPRLSYSLVEAPTGKGTFSHSLKGTTSPP